MSSKITILGSTGSIGVSALRVLRSIDHNFQLFGLSCHSNLKKFEEQLTEFNPTVAAVSSKDIVASGEYNSLKKKFSHIEFLDGENGIIELAERKVDILLSAIVGAAGLKPALKAIPNINRLALANKETLVMAGDIVTKSVNEHNVELIPIDSEHSAIFSLLQNKNPSIISRIILTASGGSMRDKSRKEMENVTLEDALIHPTWNMGRKITIDSATLMNKGLEVIETHHLFKIDYESIDVVIHPESIIHSMVETVDGAIYAYMGVPDMAHPILCALVYPEVKKNPFGKLNLAKIGTLGFYEYDKAKFPALDLCYSAGKMGGTMPAVLNSANEIAVNAFLNKRIIFTDIIKIVENTMNRHNNITNPCITDIFDSDKWAREISNSTIEG